MVSSSKNEATFDQPTKLDLPFLTPVISSKSSVQEQPYYLTLRRSPSISALRRSSPVVCLGEGHLDYSKSLEELECRNKADLLRDLNNDPPLSSTLPCISDNNGLDNEYLFHSSLDEKIVPCDEYSSLSEECSRHTNDNEFHSDHDISGWDTSDPNR